MPLNSRFYNDKYPDVDDVIMVNVLSIAQMGAYVDLLEYNNIEGMILLSELSRRRIRSVNKLLRVGKTEPVVVIRVDKDKGYIDLSKRRVSVEDIEICTERYAKAKAISSLLRHVANVLNYDTDAKLEDLYERTVWHFERKYKNKTAAYDIFKKSVNDPSVLNDCELDDNTREVLLSNIRRKLVTPALKIRADIECSCFDYEGIDAVKRALQAGLDLGTEELPIHINLIAPPLYIITTSTTKISDGIRALEVAIEAVRDKISKLDGEFKLVSKPKLVTVIDEAELANRLQRAEDENKEIAADDEIEEELSKCDNEFNFGNGQNSTTVGDGK